MFQNITEEEKIENISEEQINQEKINIKRIIRKSFTKQNIIVYIISFMLSTVTAVNGIAPFGLAIFAAVISNGLPAGIVFLVSLIRKYCSEVEAEERLLLYSQHLYLSQCV